MSTYVVQSEDEVGCRRVRGVWKDSDVAEKHVGRLMDTPDEYIIVIELWSCEYHRPVISWIRDWNPDTNGMVWSVLTPERRSRFAY